MKKTEVHLEEAHLCFKGRLTFSFGFFPIRVRKAAVLIIKLLLSHKMMSLSALESNIQWLKQGLNGLKQLCPIFQPRDHTTGRHLSSARLPKEGLDESMLHMQKYYCSWSHNGGGCCSLQRCRQGVGYGQNGLAEVVVLNWTVRTFLLLGTAWEDTGEGYDAAGPHSLLWSITEMLQEFGQIVSQFLASVSLPIKQEWCHQLQDGG